MSEQIPWRRVFVEGVVIVGSILLAFGIQAWWDGLQEREEEREVLIGLEAEFVDLQARPADVKARGSSRHLINPINYQRGNQKKK